MAEAKFVTIHGERIAVCDEGQGEPLLLIHGMAGSSQTWRAILPQLAKKYRVIAPDLLGHGRSSKPRTDYSLGAFAVGLRDLLDELGVKSATVVGHSLGGGIAMQFLYQHPDYCRRLVLISSGGLGPDVGWILRLLAAPGAEIWNAYSSFSDRQTRDAFLRTLRSVVDYRGQSVSALNRLNVRDDLPVLAIWGAEDTIIPVDHAYAALRNRPDSRLEVIPGVGHFAQVEAPTEVVDLIDDFVTTTTASGPSSAREV
jgi:pimeloyl-ACP methyl ester carboxylesterase